MSHLEHLKRSPAYSDPLHPKHESTRAEVFALESAALRRAALRVASSLEAERRHSIPAYLQESLLRYDSQLADDVTFGVLIPDRVEHFAMEGYPKSNLSTKESAYERVSREFADLGTRVLPKTVQRLHAEAKARGHFGPLNQNGKPYPTDQWLSADECAERLGLLIAKGEPDQSGCVKHVADRAGFLANFASLEDFPKPKQFGKAQKWRESKVDEWVSKRRTPYTSI